MLMTRLSHAACAADSQQVPSIDRWFSLSMHLGAPPTEFVCMAISFTRPFLIGSGFRIAVFLYALIFPILNEAGQPVSGLIVQQGIDFSFYVDSAEKLFSAPLSQIAEKFVAFYKAPFSRHIEILIAAPIVPALILGFDYQQGNTLPLALFYLGLGIALLALWLFWLRRMGLSQPMLLLFAILPNPLWFTLNISSDLPFAGLVAIFYLAYFSGKGEARFWALWGTALLLLALTRPNGISLLLFVLLHQILCAYRDRSVNIPAIACLGGITLVAGIYVLPYFSAVLHGMPREHIAYSYFGYPTQAYIGGIFELFPEWLDRPLSWLALVGAKLLYFVGLRPSYGNVEWWIVGLRGGAGLILLPGLIWVAIRGDTKHRLLIGLFLLPFLFGPSQDRYNLAIQPLLFYFGCLAYRDLIIIPSRYRSARRRRENAASSSETVFCSSD
jgi:hypothetical protein